MPCRTNNVTTSRKTPHGVGISELLAAWDMAHDSLTAVADAAKKCGHPEFAREAETIADSLESRVTALSNIARAKAANRKALQRRSCKRGVCAKLSNRKDVQ